MINENLRHKLDGFRKKYYINKLLKGSMYAVGFSLIYILVISFVEHFGHFNGNTRLGLFLVFVFGEIFIIFTNIVRPIFGLLSLGKHLSYEKAAELIGKHFPEIDDKIVNTIELGQMSGSENKLVQASLEQRTKALIPFSFNQAINFKENAKYWPILIVPILIFGVIVFSGNWKAITDGGKRIVAFDQEFLPVAPFEFVLLNNSLVTEQGESLKLRFEFKGEVIPESAQFSSNNKKGRFVRLDNNIFEYSLNNLFDDLSFTVLANGFSSQVYDIEVVPVPRVRSFLIEVNPPAYTGVKSFVASKSIIDVPEGSEVIWDLNTTSTASAYLSAADSSYYFENTKEGLFSLTLNLKESLNYQIVTENDKVKKEQAGQNTVGVIKDGFPEIDVLVEMDSVAPNTFYYSGDIADDYGFTSLRASIKAGNSTIRKRINVSSSTNVQSFSGLLKLDSLAEEGQKVTVIFEVWDNDGVNGAKKSKSRSFDFQLLSAREQQNQINEQMQSYFSDKEELQKSDEEILEELKRLREKLLNKKKADWKDKEKIKELLEKKKKIEEERKALNQKRDNLQKKEKQPKSTNEDLEKKKKSLEDLKKDKKQQELEKLLEEVSKLMDKLNPEHLEKALEQMEKLAEQNQRKEDRVDKMLEDLKFQMDVLKQVEKLKELAEEMKQLSEEKNEEGDEKERQDEIEKKLDELKKEREELEEKNEDFKRQNEENDVEKKEEEAKDEMKKSDENMEKSDQEKANENQKKSSEKMEEMSGEMMQSLMSMQSEQKKEDMKTLRQILENLEILSLDIEELAILSKESAKSDPLYRKLLREQKILKDGAGIIKDSLIALGERVPEVQEMVYEELAIIEDRLEQGIDALENQEGGKSALHQQHVMTSANNLALLLDNALKNMQKQMASMMQGSQSCQKPGSGKPSPSNMKQKQGELGKKMSEMMKGQQKGKGKPGAGKGEGRNGKEIVEMLSRQEQIRKQLEDYMSEKEGENGSQGNMAKVIEEMKKVEEDLLKGELQNEALERVKNIESKLLEFETAELEREKDEKRESKSGDELEQLKQDELDRYLEEKENEKEELNYRPLRLKEYYKKVSNRFLKAS